MADKLADFYQGETKSWRVTFVDDISNSTLSFRMAKKLEQASADLEITAVLDPPIDEGLPTQRILAATFSLAAVASAGLAVGEYYAEHEISSVGRVDIFLPQRITVKPSVPKGV